MPIIKNLESTRDNLSDLPVVCANQFTTLLLNPDFDYADNTDRFYLALSQELMDRTNSYKKSLSAEHASGTKCASQAPNYEYYTVCEDDCISLSNDNMSICNILDGLEY